MIYKKFKRHIPALTAGLGCWAFIFIISGTSCLIKGLSGFPCPGCGSSRAAAALFHGNIKQALDYHPLIFVSLGLPVIFIITYIFRLNILKFKAVNILLFIIFLVYIAVFIVRLILYYPDTEPMTYLESSFLGRFINFIKFYL